MAELILSLGTNKGDRAGNVAAALERLEIALGRPYSAISPIIETEASGFDGPPFLNAVVLYDTEMDPRTVLSVCKEIERAMGRTDPPEWDSEGRRIYHDRIIDIDILRYGDMELSTPRLTIPHPQLKNRPFFEDLMAQMREISHK